MDNFGEAIAAVNDMKAEGRPIRVIRPEYLIAMYLEESARTRKRLERVAALLDEGDYPTMKTETEPDAIEQLREGKRELRRRRVAMSLEEKVRQVVELQKIHVAVVGKRRALRPLERVWQLSKR